MPRRGALAPSRVLPLAVLAATALAATVLLPGARPEGADRACEQREQRLLPLLRQRVDALAGPVGAVRREVSVHSGCDRAGGAGPAVTARYAFPPGPSAMVEQFYRQRGPTQGWTPPDPPAPPAAPLCLLGRVDGEPAALHVQAEPGGYRVTGTLPPPGSPTRCP